ncbi:PREDICTED: uncharacterized protein LOC104754767 [Camelina sativa]|uniref:Uncharacterized protein LOC104754767 n=1 Tax=Camelina sativa TaxID=90675 RepID=A0ABM0WS15_CAMSA|nr:PREDICTED: uncharacterized protein LOC104754767 [Camelina sativa]
MEDGQNPDGRQPNPQEVIIPPPPPAPQRQAPQEQNAAVLNPPARGATLREEDAHNRLFSNRSAIQPPAPARQDYEIKHSLINLVQNRVFNGLASKSPLDHIEAFERLASTTRSNGVPYDYLMLTLFQFSLGDKALRWLNLLDRGSLTTWAQCRAQFLNHFYTKSRSAMLRSKITTFSQGGTESFCEAWERFKEYMRDCPHHGFSQENLMNIFYGGIDQKYQMALDTASRGYFSTNTAAEANLLIENLAASNSNHSHEYDRFVRVVSSVNTYDIKSLTTKVDLLLKRDQQAVNMCDGQTGAYQQVGVNSGFEGTEELNYVGGQGNYQNHGFNQNYRNHPNLSYRSTNVENPQDQLYPPHNQQGNFPQGFQNKGAGFNSSNVQGYHAPSAAPQDNKLELMMQALLEGHKKSSAEINVKIDSMYNDLNGKFERLTSRVDSIDKRVSAISSSSKNKESCNAITLHGGIEDGQSCAVINSCLASAETDRSVPSLDRSVDPVVVVESVSENSRLTATSVERPLHVARMGISDSSAPNMNTKESSLVEPKPYRPQIPFPRRHEKKPLDEKKYGRYKEAISEFIADIPFTEAVKHISLFKKNIHAPALKRLPKLEDPERFVVPCSILGVNFEDSLCDTGSSVNVMSKAIAERLGIDDMKASKVSLTFANTVTTTPQGFINNLDVRVGNCLVATDFHVVEMSEGSVMPLILGRPFLATVEAVVDLPNKRITFSNIYDKFFYNAITANEAIRHGSCLVVEHEKKVDVMIMGESADKNEVNEVLDGDTHSSKKSSKNVKNRDKPKIERVIPDLHITLVPQKYVRDTIEYKVKCKGISRPFSKVKAILTPEFKEKGEEAMDDMLKTILELKLTNWRACSDMSSHPPIT